MNEDIIECATIAGSRSSAYRSLARHAGVSLGTVIDAADKGELRSIVDIAERPERRIAYLREGMEERDAKFRADMQRRTERLAAWESRA